MKTVALPCLLVASLAATDVSAVTRYVRSPIGNDQGGANACTDISNPCLTLAHAESQLDADDTLWVAGTFTESVSINTPVTIIGRTTALFPTAFPPCNGDDCPTITSPGVTSALEVAADISVQWINFEDSMSGDGAAIFAPGASSTQISDCSFSGNGHPDNFGGAIFFSGGTVTIERTTFDNNAARAGGAIHSSSANVTIIDGTFSQNTAVEDGGAVYLSSGTVSIQDSTFSQNTAVDSGGAIHVEDGTLLVDNSPMTMNVSTSQGGAIAIVGGSGHQIDNSTLDNNQVEATAPGGSGGALYLSEPFQATVTLDNVSITNNAVVAANAADFASGGGVTAAGGGSVTILASEISSNEILNSNNPRGDGVRVTGRNLSIDGSLVLDNGAVGISVFAGNVDISDSTIGDHIQAGIIVEGDGRPAMMDSGSLTSRASTIRGNGDGIRVLGAGDVELVNTTLSANTTNLNVVGGGGIFGPSSAVLINSTLAAPLDQSIVDQTSNNASVTLTDTIVEGSCGGDPPTLTPQNIYDDASCGPSPVGVLGIGPLENNGGPTLTHALTDDSPAVDAGGLRCQLDPVNFVDQRGVARPFGSACDAGAFELTAADSDRVFANGFETP